MHTIINFMKILYAHCWIIIFLTLIWCGFSHNFQIYNIIIGLTLSSLVHFLVATQKLDYSINIFHLVILCIYTIWELLLSGVQVSWDILTPKNRSQPKLIELPVENLHPVAKALLANLISLTPGTIVVNADPEKETMLVHVMFAQDKDKTLEFINKKLIKKIQKVIKYV